FKKIREGATTFVSWEKSPKKEGTYPKMEITTKVCHKLQRLDIDYKTTNCTDRIFIKVCSVCFLRLQKFVVSAYFHYKVCSVRFFSLPVCSICFLRIQKFVVHFSDI
ncbi:hypothetical protein K443DRAFT_105804, partial [Laccaria amethystina LaAM-08-1]